MKKDIAIIRESIGRIVSMLTEKQIKVTQQGASAFVEYNPTTGAIKRVNIPYINDDATEEFIAAVQGFLDHEVGHVLFSDQSVLMQIKGEGAALKNLDNLIEDIYIERMMTSKFAGSGYNLNKVREFFLNKITAPAIEAAVKEGDMKTAQAYAMVAAFRAWGGQTTAADFIKQPVIAEVVAPIKAMIPDHLLAQLQTVKNSHEVLALAREIKKCMDDAEREKIEEKRKEKEKDKSEKGDPTEPTPDAEEGDFGDDSGDAGDDIEKSGKDEKTSKADDSGKKRDEKLEDAAPPSEEDGEGETSPDKGGESGASPEDGTDEEDEEGGLDGEPTDSETAEDSEEATMDDLLEALKDFDEEMAKLLSEEARSAVDSGNVEYPIFSTEWDEVVPAKKAKNFLTVERVEALTKDKIGVMAKSLERGIAAQAKKAWNAGQRKGRVAPGALFKTAVGDDRIFRTRYETKAKNTAISLVVDCSGSMRGTKIKLASEASFGIASVLERLRIPFEVIGFTTTENRDMRQAVISDATPYGWSRTVPLYMPVFKPFGGKFDSDAKSKIAALSENPSWLSENIDGECIQIAARRLAKQKSERKIMIVLSDGSPCCPYTKNLRPHLKKVVNSLNEDNIEVIAIGIQTDCVREYYKKNVVINNIDELPETTMKELTKLLLA